MSLRAFGGASARVVEAPVATRRQQEEERPLTHDVLWSVTNPRLELIDIDFVGGTVAIAIEGVHDGDPCTLLTRGAYGGAASILFESERTLTLGYVGLVDCAESGVSLRLLGVGVNLRVQGTGWVYWLSCVREG
jgi:hypothetical protein